MGSRREGRHHVQELRRVRGLGRLDQRVSSVQGRAQESHEREISGIRHGHSGSASRGCVACRAQGIRAQRRDARAGDCEAAERSHGGRARRLANSVRVHGGQRSCPWENDRGVVEDAFLEEHRRIRARG